MRTVIFENAGRTKAFLLKETVHKVCLATTDRQFAVCIQDTAKNAYKLKIGNLSLNITNRDSRGKYTKFNPYVALALVNAYLYSKNQEAVNHFRCFIGLGIKHYFQHVNKSKEIILPYLEAL